MLPESATPMNFFHLEQIIRDVIAPNAVNVDEERRFPKESIQALAEAGFLKLTIPKRYGGWEAKPMQVFATINRIAQACASTAMIYVMHLTTVNSLVFYCNESQIAKYLHPVVEGRWLVSEAISEPGSGSQWWSLVSTSERLRNGWYHLQAKKSFCTSSGYADLYTVSTVSPGQTDHKKHALFLVPATTPGIRSGAWNGLGLAGNMSGTIEFDCLVEPDCLLFGGASDDGLKLYNEANQPIYHLGVAAVYVGIARAAYEQALRRIQTRQYARQATTYGQRLQTYPIAQRHLGEMAVRLFQAESLVEKLALAMEQGRSFDDIAVLMTATKVAAAEAANAVPHQAMMASGGTAYIKGILPLERYLRDGLAASLMGPNDDFCKELIGRLVLGLGTYHEL